MSLADPRDSMVDTTAKMASLSSSWLDSIPLTRFPRFRNSQKTSIMAGTETIIAIIPARGGSKRIPGKNIRPLVGKPIIAYTIAAARESGLFERVVVSTDSPEIAEVARQYDAEVPFLRDENLADDFTPVSSVTADALFRLDPAGDNLTRWPS